MTSADWYDFEDFWAEVTEMLRDACAAVPDYWAWVSPEAPRRSRMALRECLRYFERIDTQFHHLDTALVNMRLMLDRMRPEVNAHNRRDPQGLLPRALWDDLYMVVREFLFDLNGWAVNCIGFADLCTLVIIDDTPAEVRARLAELSAAVRQVKDVIDESRDEFMTAIRPILDRCDRE